jgi:Ni,Fe-hydrogenase maturation factor
VDSDGDRTLVLDKKAIDRVTEVLRKTLVPAGGLSPTAVHTMDTTKIIPWKIWFNAHDGLFFTTVEWTDGTKTTVSIPNNLEDLEYSGFTAALAKKIFGGKAARLMQDAVDKANEPARIREEKRKAEKEKRKANEEQKRKSHDWRVARRIEELKIEREARTQLFLQTHKIAVERPEGKELKKAFEPTAKELLNQSEGETKS